MYRTLILFLLLASQSFGQPPNYDNLMMLYADGNSSKLIKSAKKYCNQTRTKNDPLPHLWLSRGYYLAALQTHSAEDNEYKNKCQLAVNELYICIQLDTNRNVQTNYSDCFDKIKNSIIEEMLYDINSFKPTLFWVNEYRKISPNNPGLSFLESYSYLRSDNQMEADKSLLEAERLLPSIEDFNKWQTTEVLLFQQGVLLMVSFLEEKGQKEKAQVLVEKTKQYFKTDLNGNPSNSKE